MQQRLVGLLLVLVPAVAAAAELRGRVDLAAGPGGKTSPDLKDTVIYFTPVAATPGVAAGRFDVVTQKKEFNPRILAVPVGSTVSFPNEDPILHNVFSVSRQNRFDLGLYRRGEARQVTFHNPGVVRVYCNVHHSMVAYVVVLDTPFHTAPDAGGAFRLSGLPEGEGTLTVWHERTRPWSQTVQLPLDRAVSVTLEVTKSRLPRHLNKFGKPYSRDRRRYR